jgi:aspartyl/asparaginyl beta-hydroxylase (cupin superfamily)
MALLLSRVTLPELAQKIYTIALQEYFDEIIEYKCFNIPFIIMKNEREYKDNSKNYVLHSLLIDVTNIRNNLESFKSNILSKYENHNIVFPKHFKELIKEWSLFIKQIKHVENEFIVISLNKLLYSIDIIINNDLNY